MGCSSMGTFLYKPDESVLKSMSYRQAKYKAESLYKQINPKGNLQVYDYHIHITEPGGFKESDDCYFNEMPIEIKDYGSLAGGGPYPIGSRYSVRLGPGQGCGYIMFKDYEMSKAFADAVYVLKNTPREERASFSQTQQQGPVNPPTTLPTALPLPTESAPPF